MDEYENIINEYVNLVKNKGKEGFEEMIDDLAFKRLDTKTEGYILGEVCDRLTKPFGYSYALSYLLRTHRALVCCAEAHNDDY